MRTIPSHILLLFAATACASGSSVGTSPAPAASADASTSGTRPLVASLQPINTSGNRLIGTVKLTPTSASEYRAEVQIRNGGGVQNKFPWVIRPGQCGDDGRDVLGNELAYRVLETTADGTARIAAPLRIQIPVGAFHVNVLKGTSAADREVVVACGVLTAG
jgi:hypothetical protein